MDLQNTFKSRIRENKLDQIYLAQIDNYTNFTDTISKPVDKKFVQFYFCTKGTASFHFTGERKPHIMTEGHSILLFDSRVDIPINISLSKKSKLMILVITIQKMENIFEETGDYVTQLLLNTLQKVYKEKKLSIPEKLIISQLEEYSLDEVFEVLYLNLKIQELLMHYLSSSSKQNTEKFKDEKLLFQIQKIKEILQENIFSPPTIKMLAEEFKISEYKIKEGFKKLYGKTISNFILDTKLEIGKEKLDMKVKQVQEIAYDLGYENPSHFIEAFKKKFGITPKQWMMK